MKRTLSLLLLAAWVAGAQTNSTEILGVITDPNGGAVPAAAVEATKKSTGEKRSVVTDQEGRYTISNLQIGEYEIVVQATGFQRQRVPTLTLEIDQKARVDLQLKIGSVAETVEVNSAAPVLKTDDATVGEVVDHQRIVELPLNGRNFAQLATIATPGVRMGYQTFGGGERLYAAGQRENQNQFTLDGSVIQNNLINSVSFRPSIDAIEEFKVQTGNFSAEYGMFSGAQVTLSLRSGSNDIHVTLFEFLRNDVMDAKSFFERAADPRAPLRRNQFGFVVAGPVLIPRVYNGKNKTFFMVNSEFLRNRQAGTGLLTVPTAAQRGGDLSNVKTVIKDPISKLPFPGNIIPTNRIAPQATALLSFVPPGNTTGTANYLSQSKINADNNEFLTRLDHNFTDNDRLFGHFVRQTNQTATRPDYPTNIQNEGTNDWNASIQETHLFSANAINEIRFGYTRLKLLQNNGFSGTSFSILKTLGMVGFPEDSFTTGLPNVSVTGYLSLSSQGPLYQVDETAQLADNFSLIRGAHALKFGADLRRGRIAREAANFPRASLSFTGDITGNALADFLLGYPRNVSGVENLSWAEARDWRMGFYAMDDWHVSNKLTLNLGIRYELNTVPIDPYGRLRTLNPKDPTQLIPGVYTVAAPFKGDHNDFAPRFGFAYRPFGNKTVFRGGYGIYYNANQLNNFTLLQSNPPYKVIPTLVSDPNNPSVTIANPFAVNGVLQPGPFNITTVDLCGCLPNTYNQNWTFNIQRQLPGEIAVEVGYVGAHSVHLDHADQANTAPPGPGAVQARRPYPVWADVRAIRNDGSSNYNALQAQFRKRYSHGLTILGAYSYSKSIDDVNDFNSGDRAQDPTKRYLERGSSQFDFPQRLTFSGVYQLPFFAGSKSGIVKTVLGGWQLNGIFTGESGKPFSVYASGDIANTGGSGQRANRLADGRLSSDARSIYKWFDTTAFANPAPYTFGNAGRFILRGPHTITLDGGLSKNFVFHERNRVEFRAEFFSLTNTPLFGNPNSTVGTPTFGQITSSAGGNRTIQLGLKYAF